MSVFFSANIHKIEEITYFFSILEPKFNPKETNDMEKKLIEIVYEEVAYAELDLNAKLLYDAALRASEGAYAPYSHFQVGAAAMLQNGKMVTGCNQENAAYPSGLCAERVTLFAAQANNPGVPVCRLAIIAQCNGEVQAGITPCGACCQVMLETEERSGQPMEILLCGKETVRILHGVRSLLPFSFTPDNLLKE